MATDLIQKSISIEDAHTLKAQLFELCKQGDIDKNELISFDEFSSVIQKFLPNTSNQKMNEMFSALDGNKDGNVSYVEFLADANFNKFLQTCGYFIVEPNKLNDQIICAQKEVIEKLNDWIKEEGKPSKERMECLQIENDAMNEQISDFVFFKKLWNKLCKFQILQQIQICGWEKG